MRIALALSYIKGLRVDDWVFQQVREVTNKVYGNHLADPPIQGIWADTNEWLWQDFLQNFEAAFVDTALVEQAYADLLNL